MRYGKVGRAAMAALWLGLWLGLMALVGVGLGSAALRAQAPGGAGGGAGGAGGGGDPSYTTRGAGVPTMTFTFGDCATGGDPATSLTYTPPGGSPTTIAPVGSIQVIIYMEAGPLTLEGIYATLPDGSLLVCLPAPDFDVFPDWGTFPTQVIEYPPGGGAAVLWEGTMTIVEPTDPGA